MREPLSAKPKRLVRIFPMNNTKLSIVCLLAAAAQFRAASATEDMYAQIAQKRQAFVDELTQLQSARTPGPSVTMQARSDVSIAALATGMEVQAVAQAKSIEDSIKSVGFSAGFGAIYILGDAPIDTATAEPGQVLNVTHKSNARVGQIFEVHFLQEDPERREQSAVEAWNIARAYQLSQISPGTPQTPPSKTVTKMARGWMVAMETGDDLIKSFGVGYMWARRQYKINPVDGSAEFKGPAFNLGVLVLVDPHVKALADGLTPGQPVPPGVSIRIEEETRLGVGIIFSAGF